MLGPFWPPWPASRARGGRGRALAKKIDAVMSEIYKPGQPARPSSSGRTGTFFRKGYAWRPRARRPGRAGYGLPAGSITKQFTAVAILLLAQEGKLGLRDEITKFLPDYPTQGRKITVEHLLTHTSGIQSYTDLANGCRSGARTSP